MSQWRLTAIQAAVFGFIAVGLAAQAGTDPMIWTCAALQGCVSLGYVRWAVKEYRGDNSP